MNAARKAIGRRSIAAIALGLAAVLAGACGSSSDNGSSTTAASSSASDLAPVHGTYKPNIDPANFVTKIDNPWFPLIPGTGFHYAGVAENGHTKQFDDETVTNRTKKVLGVNATIVHDVVSDSKGRPVEKTFDWYAQDKQGNVWYMGEDTRELNKSHKFVKQSDSWEAGVDGAEPGIIMPGNPQKGDQYRQEYYPKYALDQAKVLGSGGPLTVPQGSYKKTLLTEETAPKLDPGVAERKWYVKGVGDIQEHTISGNKEEIKLIRITHG
jgi:hypothetical protein